MKKFKVLLTLTLICVLLANCTVLCFATDRDVDVTIIGTASVADVEEISEIVETYMRRYTENTYLYESNDLHPFTVASLTPTERQALPLEQNSLSTNIITSAKLGENLNLNTGVNIEPNKMVNTLDTMDYTMEKAIYLKNVRQMQIPKRNDFEICYKVNKIEISGIYSRVWLSENIGFYCPGQTIQSIIGEEHEISLCRQNGEWLIYNISTANDSFDYEHKFTDFDSNSAIQEFNEIYSRRNLTNFGEIEQDIIVSEENENTEIQSTLLMPRSYNTNNAINYAFTYSKQNVNSFQNYYNTNFRNWANDGGDCMNFASQCIYAGFLGSNDISDINSKSFPQDNVGNSSNAMWVGASPYYSWISNTAFYNYMVNSASDTGTRIKGSITTYGKDDYYITTPSNLLGAVIQGNGSAGEFQHAVIVTGKEGTGRNQIYVTSHTADKKHVPLSDFWTTGKIRVILPTSAVQVVSCPYDNHSYSTIPYDRGLDSICNSCGTSRLFLRNVLLNCVPVGSTQTLQGYPSIRCYRMAMKVIAPNGEVSWLGEVLNEYSYTKSFTFTQRGLYTITLYARDVNPDYYSSSVNIHNTYTVRCY